MVAVIDPAGAEGELFRQVLVVFVAEAVGADEGAGFGVANVSGLLSTGRGKGVDIMEGALHLMHLGESAGAREPPSGDGDIPGFFQTNAARVADRSHYGRHDHEVRPMAR